MRWWKATNDLAWDPMLRLIGNTAGASPAHVLAVWVAMNCHASAQVGDGRGTLRNWSDDAAAAGLGIERACVLAVRQAMEGRLLDGPVLIDWLHVQRAEDRSTERVRRFRERRREQAAETGKRIETRSTESETGERPETGRGEEKRGEEKNPPPAPQHPSPARAAVPRGKQLTVEEWSPSADLLEHATEQFPRIDTAHELRLMRAWWSDNHPGVTRGAVLWDQRYAEWIGRSSDRLPPAGSGPARNGGLHALLSRARESLRDGPET